VLEGGYEPRTLPVLVRYALDGLSE
jgi:hypothetical protein